MALASGAGIAATARPSGFHSPRHGQQHAADEEGADRLRKAAAGHGGRRQQRRARRRPRDADRQAQPERQHDAGEPHRDRQRHEARGGLGRVRPHRHQPLQHHGEGGGEAHEPREQAGRDRLHQRRAFGSVSSTAARRAAASGVTWRISRASRFARSVTAGVEAGGVEHHARVRLPREAREILGIIPDQSEILVHLMHQTRRGLATPAMLQRREIGRRDLQRRGQILQRDLPLRPQLAKARAEGRHAGWFCGGEASVMNVVINDALGRRQTRIAYGHATSGGSDIRIASTLPPVRRPNSVPRSWMRLNST
jgi:hypothetical protein